LLALQNGSLIALTDSVWIIPKADIISVNLEIDQERTGWVVLTAITQAIPTAVLLGSDNPETVRYGLIGVAVTAGTIASFVLSEPRQIYKWPLPPDQAETFQSYLRYPYGISPGQLQQLRETFRGVR
jgi:hypothetical protein